MANDPARFADLVAANDLDQQRLAAVEGPVLNELAIVVDHLINVLFPEDDKKLEFRIGIQEHRRDVLAMFIRQAEEAGITLPTRDGLVIANQRRLIIPS